MRRVLWKQEDLRKHEVLKQAQFTMHINNNEFGQTTTDSTRSKDDRCECNQDTPRAILPGGQSVQTHCPIWRKQNVLLQSLGGEITTF